MLLSAIDFLDVALFIGKQLLIIVAIYFLVILLVRFSGYYKLTKCPECGNKLKRSSRGSTERMVQSISFGLLPLKRYRCYSCYWEGPLLEIKKSSLKPDDEFEEETTKEDSNEMTAV